MNEQQQNEELQQRVEEALIEAYPNVSTDNFKLLCWFCGVNPHFIEQAA